MNNPTARTNGLDTDLAHASETISAQQARIAELRDVLESILVIGFYEQEMKQKALSRTDDLSALNEAKAKVLEEAADGFYPKRTYIYSDWSIADIQAKLRHRAQEIREGK